MPSHGENPYITVIIFPFDHRYLIVACVTYNGTGNGGSGGDNLGRCGPHLPLGTTRVSLPR